MTHDMLNTIVQKHDPTFRDVGSVFLQKLDAVLTPSSVLVDVGCGRTNYGEVVYRKAGKRIGVDVDPYAKENTLMDEVHIMESDAHIPLPDACADVVTAQWVVEHVRDPDVFFSEIKRILLPGGAFVFMTTNIRSPMMAITSLVPTGLKSWFRARFLGYARDETFPTVYAMNSRSRIEELCAQHGFELCSLDHIESFGYFRFSRIALSMYLVFVKLLRIFTRDREMHLVGMCRKGQNSNKVQ